MSKEPKRDTRILDHEADGIKELDNLLPRWWLWLFWLCNGFGLVYMLYFHVFHLGDLQAASYTRETEQGNRIKAAALADFEAHLTSYEPSNDPTTLRDGQRVFGTYCAPCHRMDGGGLVGPNLCDDYWIHGSNFQDNLKTIVNGVPEKGMLTWRGILKPNEIQGVASYIFTLRGTKPLNPKPPENQAAVPSNQPSQFE